jgi:choline dehydrogenase-like flavoprotein
VNDLYDVVVVGSGFGGAVMASRLAAEARRLSPGARVLVLEKGGDPTGALDPRQSAPALNAQGNRFRHTLAPDYLANFAQLFTDPEGSFRAGAPSMNVIAGRGLGGGSNVYDAVSLRAPAAAFEQRRDGRRLWPALYSRAALDPYYAAVEARLKVHRLAWTGAAAPHWQLATKRDYVFAEGCRRVGATCLPLKLADDDDANEGWWNQGQRFGGRQSLTLNYLRDAREAGAELRAGCDVEAIAPAPGGGYVVRGRDATPGAPAAFEIECRLLVVAGGAVGSTALLQRSAAAFAGARELDPGGRLGKHVSGNGDYGTSGAVGRDFAYPVEGHKGKPMASFCPSYWREHQFILIPFYAAPLYLALGQPSTLLRAKRPDAFARAGGEVADGPDGRPERDWGLAYKQRLKSFGERMLTVGCLAFDAGEGEIRPAAAGTGATVHWRETDAATDRRWRAAVDAMRRIFEALGGEMYLDGYRKDGTVNTAHPLGGCRMAERADPSEGVVDPFGESPANENLFVLDAAVVPSALGVNPSLTIAAVAELVADRLVRGDGTKPLRERLKL